MTKGFIWAFMLFAVCVSAPYTAIVATESGLTGSQLGRDTELLNKTENTVLSNIGLAHVKPVVSASVVVNEHAGNRVIQPLTLKHKSGQEVLLHSWVKDGWNRLRQDNDIDKAMHVWSKGVRQLPPDEILLFSGVFYDRDSAISQLYIVGEKHNGLILHENFHGKPAFYVLAVSPSKQLSYNRAYLHKHLGISHPKGKKAIFFQQMHVPTHRHAVSAKPMVGHTITMDSYRVVAVHHSDSDMAVPEMITMAHDAEEKGDYTHALALLSHVLGKQPWRSDVQLITARLTVKNGQYEQAIQSIAPLLTKKSTDWHVWFWNGTAHLMLGHLDRAGASLNEALALDGKHAAVWVERALVEQQRSHYDAALQMLMMAEVMQPGLPEVQLNIAWTSDKLSLHNRATQAYREFLYRSGGMVEYTATRKKVIQLLTGRPTH